MICNENLTVLTTSETLTSVETLKRYLSTQKYATGSLFTKFILFREVCYRFCTILVQRKITDYMTSLPQLSENF